MKWKESGREWRGGIKVIRYKCKERSENGRGRKV